MSLLVQRFVAFALTLKNFLGHFRFGIALSQLFRSLGLKPKLSYLLSRLHGRPAFAQILGEGKGRQLVSSKAKGPREKGVPRNHHREISSRKNECRFLYDSCGRDRSPFWPFLGEGVWGNIRRPLVLPVPLFYCRIRNDRNTVSRVLFRKRELTDSLSLSFAASPPVSSAKNLLSSLWCTNSGLRGTHWALFQEPGEGQKSLWVRCS